MKNRQTGTVTGVHGRCIIIANDLYSTIYAYRDALCFPDPYIGLTVTFELRIVPDLKNPVADKVRRI